jgi:hypothetical protein
LNEALINSNPTEQKRLAEDVQKRAIEIRDRLAEISISDAFRAHTEANKKLISEITEIHNTIKVFKGERIPAIIENLDPQRNGGITSEAFGEKLKPAILLFQEAIQAYDELLISTDKPTEQLTKLTTIQQPIFSRL